MIESILIGIVMAVLFHGVGALGRVAGKAVGKIARKIFS